MSPGGPQDPRERVYPTAMPTFCRHNRFIERCPICSKTLPGNPPAASSLRARRKASTRARTGGERSRRRRARGEGLRVRREGRAEDDGYRSELVPGLRASADAEPAGAGDRLLQRQAARAGGRAHLACTRAFARSPRAISSGPRGRAF